MAIPSLHTTTSSGKYPCNSAFIVYDDDPGAGASLRTTTISSVYQWLTTDKRLVTTFMKNGLVLTNLLFV